MAMEDKFGITNYAKASDPAELEKMEDLLKRDPDSVPLLEWIAFMYYTSDNTKRAVELYEKLVRLQADNEGHHYYLANLYKKTDQADRAIQHWRKVMALNPQSKFADKARRLLQEHAG
jgi:tetratricopeptide (TPR) repeat protein